MRYVEAILKANPAQVDKDHGPTQVHKQTKAFPKPSSKASRKEKKKNSSLAGIDAKLYHSLPQPASPPPSTQEKGLLMISGILDSFFFFSVEGKERD